MAKNDFKKLYKTALAYQHYQEYSPFVSAGGVVCAFMTDKGHIYAGVNVDTKCSLGTCAERNAINTMLTNGENVVTKLVCVYRDGRLLTPCGACGEFFLQLAEENKEMEILLNLDNFKTIKLKELFSKWWGKDRY